MTAFLDFAEQNDLALFPMPHGNKVPHGIVSSFAHDWSRDRNQWEAWLAVHACNFGIVAGPSRIVIADIDVAEVGPVTAWKYWEEWCTSRELPVYTSYCRSARGGWHVAFALPPDLDVTTLRQVPLIGPIEGISKKPVVDLRVGNGFAVAPGSFYNGIPKGEESGMYVLLSNAKVHVAPAELLSACARASRQNVTDRAGTADAGDTAKALEWMAEHDCFASYSSWLEAGMILRGEFGDDPGFSLWQLTNDGSCSAEAEEAKWHSFSQEPSADGVKIGTLRKRAHDAGCPHTIRPSTESMFAGVAALASLSAPTTAVPMLSGRGDMQAKLWAPILAAVPQLERTADHPELPDIGHPIRDAINRAIPGIIASGNIDALAVVECVHPSTAAMVAAITPAVKARAEALRQDVEHRLAPGDYTRDHKGSIERDNPDNVRFLLASLNMEVRYNAWLERVELQGWKWPTWTELSDSAVAVLMTRAAQTGTRFTPAVDFVWRTIQALAVENAQDPACEVLDDLEKAWDGEARLHSWLSNACGVPYDAYHQAVSATIFLGLVARIRCPGVKFDLMPVFVSERQGTSKSTLARMLALNDAWFVENVALGESAKELVLLLAGKSVAEISEMRTRGEVDAVKAMISATHDEGRPAYGRATVKRPRRNIFIGTTNRLEFLEDPTGGRRFLPIVVQSEIDLEWVRLHLPQLVGEAATLQSRGTDINLPRGVWALAGEHQLAATAQSSAEMLLRDWFAGDEPCWISSANLVLLLRQALGRDVSRGAYVPVMTKLGFQSKPHRGGEGVQRGWVRGMPAVNAPGFGAQLGVTGRPVLQRLLEPPRPEPRLPALPY
ncbi:VapE domain-containing protein [Bradyrhizobium sp. BWC-3-1]|uniref:VapE domain-containing protein n=1 Tax=Bradyrhizobium sp. BWC-3-1 TaxID=3080012 RepID=UPI00293E893B|nr:VapE domain-containing protein [Bradyrhizobium sp. BWC-3-1]WOH58523.1 VapE family protein [Bradyrhizobium sp. BWC-3-1]